MTAEGIAAILVAFGGVLGVYAKFRVDIDKIAMAAVMKAVESERKTYGETIAAMRSSIAECARERIECSERMDELQFKIEERNLSIDMLTGEVHRLRDLLAEVPRLVERLSMTIARVGKDRTPTPTEMDTLREMFAKLDARPSLATDILLAKANP